MAKVTRSTAGAKHVANKEKFNGQNFTAFDVKVNVSNGRAERLAMKQRLAEAKSLVALPVTAGLVRVDYELAFSL